MTNKVLRRDIIIAICIKLVLIALLIVGNRYLKEEQTVKDRYPIFKDS